MFDELKPHLAELRKRLAISAASLITMFFVMFYFHEPLLEWMVAPLNTALIEVGKVSVHAANGMITTSQVGGAFFCCSQSCIFCSDCRFTACNPFSNMDVCSSRLVCK